MIASLPLALSVTGPQALHLLGRLHPAVVHFPIALITIAAVLESLQLLRRKPALHAGTPTCLVFGALGGVLAAAFGWLLEDAEGGGGAVVDWHKWIGIASAVIGVVAALFLVRAAASDRARLVLRATLFLGAALVGLTGYLGGEMVFGTNHLLKNVGIFDEPQVAKSVPPEPAPAPPADLKVATATAADFDHDIAPILRDYCLRCHGGEKTKGKLSLKSRSDALKEAANGVSLVPGQPDKSTLYTRLVDGDDEDRMPPKKEKQLTPEQVKRVHQWIKEGAKWPEDVVLK
jgi:uncharacterized membrane protein